MKIYIGIDIGKKGGIAILKETGEIETIRMPADKKVLLHLDLIKYIGSLKSIGGDKYICLEKTSSRPGEGVVSAYKFGYAAGGLGYLLYHLSFEDSSFKWIHHVHPITWKRHFELLDSNCSKYQKKKLSVDYCNKEYNMSLKYKDDGMADAILLAKYMEYTVLNIEKGE